MRRGNKKGMEIQMMGYILIGLAALAILVGLALLLRGRGSGAITFIKNFLRFGS